MDITTQADRAGRADQFGDLYDASQLKAANMADLGSAAQDGSARTLQRTVTVRDMMRATPLAQKCKADPCFVLAPCQLHMLFMPT